MLTSKATLKTIRENWGLAYSAAFVLCTDFKIDPNDIVMEVAVILQINQTPTKVPVKYFEKNGYHGNFSVCVKPFHYNFNRAVWLVEFIELHRILGVEKFFFYNHTVGADLEKVLQYYIKENIVDIQQWTLPVVTQKEIRTEGLFAALNDCNLRNVGRYKYTIMIDVDEFIIPKLFDNYTALITSLGDKTTYVFQNVFFYLYWDNDTSVTEEYYGSPDSLGTKLFGSKDEAPYLLTAYKTIRSTKIHKHGSRSKYITKPEKATECGNHLVWSDVGKPYY
ncbi:UNVERIFIED_CONTAM: hypothetical protein GTU68_040841 [Idotea baltica]|nr:hypothetical protein [Idotea baltica]